MVEPSQRQPSQGKSGQRKSRQEQPGQSKGIKSRSAQSERKEVKGNYRDLLNSVITEAAARSSGVSDGTLFTSRIGATVWTSREKDCLFRRMCLTGRDDLLSLRRAVPTKNESEIKTYLQLLDRESRKTSSRTDFRLSDVPAAVEISEDCVHALEDSANSLATLVNDHDTTAQQDEFGENWLIDEEAAYYIDLVFDQAPEKDQMNEDATNPHKTEHEDDEKPSVSNEAPPIAESDASITLLRPSSFLQLSRSLFMNSNADPSYNWQSADLLSESVESPAIFRGAFEDLHNLTVSLTRRLVQLSLFQAMTRLRAGDSSRPDWSPLAAVREVDVRSALEILEMKPNAHDFWAKAARRCNVDVYTDSKKYMDGRRSTKTGVKLTYDEVEAEMGLEKASTSQVEVEEIAEADIDDLMDESDLFTETDTDEDLEPGQEEIPSNKRARSRSLSQKRNRALSPSSFFRGETRYLNVMDYNASVEEETRLWKILRADPPESVNLQHTKLPEHPGRAETVADDWRGTIQYEAEWERPLGCMGPEGFVEMERMGTQKRRRREMIFDGVRRREEVGKVGETDGGSDDEMEDDDDEISSEDSSEKEAVDESGVADAASDEMEVE